MRATTSSCCKLLFACCCIFFAFTQSGQAQVVFALGNVNGPAGSNVVVPVTAESQFTDLIAIQGTITFDTAVVAFDTLQSLNIAGWTGLLDSVPGSPGVITFSFDKTNPATGTTLPDGTTIFSIRFTLVGNGGDETGLAFTDVPTPFLVADVNLVEDTTVVGVEGSILIDPNPLTNDACSDATSLACGDTIPGTTVGATLDPIASTCPSVPVTLPGVWYTFVGTGTTMLVSLQCDTPGWNGRISVYTGDCIGGFDCVGANEHFCGLPVGVSFDSDLGTVYYILVHDMSVNSAGSFLIGLECTFAENDACASALSIGCNQTVSGSTTDATVDVVPTCGDDATAPGVWYTFTGTGDFVTVSTCSGNTAYDTRLSIYSGDCNNLTCVTENDDDFNCSAIDNQSTATFQSVIGTNYFFYVHGFLDAEGDFELSVTCELLEGLCSQISFEINDTIPPAEDTIVVAGETGVITDVDISFNILHTYIGDVKIMITSPSGTSLILYNQDCGGQEDILATFDDGGLPNYNGCDMSANIAVAPFDALSAFNGEDPNGIWTVTITDTTPGDDGSLESWCLLITTGECAFATTCDDENACTDDECDNGTCVNTPLSTQCLAPDVGGTADFPPPCYYNGQIAINSGLAGGATLTTSGVKLGGFFNLSVNPGGVLNGDSTTADGEIFIWELMGSGPLSGFNRTFTIPLSMFEVHTAPKPAGALVQTFDVDLRRLFAQLSPGDPDFETFQITAGTDLGLPSSGKVTLSEEGGSWKVSSYIDVTYRIDFEGAAGSQLAGDSGSVFGTFRFDISEPACNDVNSCTNDFCFQGVCVSDTITCNDQDACTTDLCTDGICSNTPISCDTSDLCLEGVCDNGTCVYTATDCNDNDACTLDSCLGGGLCDNVAINCDDNNLCTTDNCDVLTGCTNTLTVLCDDNNACTGIETCDSTSGTCIPGTPLVCTDDGDTCTIESCDVIAGCVTTVNPNCIDPCDTLNCDDSEVCTVDTCLNGACEYTNVKPELLFDAANVCAGDSFTITNNSLGVDAGATYFVDENSDGTIEFTIPAANFPAVQRIAANGDLSITIEVFNPNGCGDTAVIELTAVICDDNDACTIDTCISLTCSTTPLVCDDNSACTSDGCDPVTGCTFDPISCDDLNACTIDGCDSTNGCTNTPVVCDDSSACTLNLCDAGTGCFYSAITCADDGDTCTIEFCDSTLGCTFSINPNCVDPCDTLNCNDSDICTVDTCVAGVCQNNFTFCDDNNPCTLDACLLGTCSYTPNPCDDLNACTDTDCDTLTGCLFTAIVCNDNSACTNDICDSGLGCVYTPINCDDSNLCTTDGCDSLTGCTNVAIVCNDSSACTTDICDSGLGCTYSLINCDDSDLCTTDGCDSLTGCTNVAVVCNDSSACTTDICDSGLGCTYTLINCDDSDLCTIDGCDSLLGCTNITLDCNDFDACSLDSCAAATGCFYTAVVCNDSSACTTDVCDITTGCVYAAIVCDDNNACTGIETCDSLTGCLPGTPLNCDDSDTCTIDACDALLGCTYALNPNCVDPCDTLNCDDLNACTLDSCGAITGCFYTPVVCNDANLCTTDDCDQLTGCTTAPVVCDDGDGCTTDGCDPLTGCTTTPVNCDDSSLCTIDDCILGACVNTPIDCDDSSVCTIDQCVDGLCEYGDIPCTQDADSCTIEVCDSLLGCISVPRDCSDGDLCTQDLCQDDNCFNPGIPCAPDDACSTAVCDSGICVQTPIVCNDNNACTTDGCDSLTGCTFTPIVCNDGDLCTDDGCDNVLGCTTSEIICNDGNACTDDFCNPALGCITQAVNCNDGDACTLDSCNSASGCFYTNVVCNDSSACTTDACNILTGCTFSAIVCDDLNACTTDGCDSTLGCTTTPVDCDDNSLCTTEICNPATGCIYTLVDCDDLNACTTDGCDDATGCTTTPVVCDDIDACTTDGCDSALGCTATVIICDDLNACTTDGCDSATGCTFVAIVCDDLDACTTDGCDSATGCTTTPVVCDDNSACTTDGCDSATGCTTTAIVCNDNNACTTDGCDPLTGCTFVDIVCDDLDACTTDGCDTTSGCTTTPVVCDDNNACTTDGCDSATGCTFVDIICDDLDACTTDGCDTTTGCTTTSVVCNDNNACTTDGCDSATGCTFVDIICDDLDACTNDDCDTTTGCTFTAIVCDDGDTCTADICVAGVCTVEPILSADADTIASCPGDVRTLTPAFLYGTAADYTIAWSTGAASDTLDVNPLVPATYSFTATTTGSAAFEATCSGSFFVDAVNCDDGDACTDDVCTNGICTYSPVNCDDNSVCTLDSCNSGTGCFYTNINCDDGDFCTIDACDAVLGCTYEDVICDDTDPCTDDFCNPAIGCITQPHDCNDGSLCTLDSCETGVGCFYTAVICDDGDLCTTDTCIALTGCAASPVVCDDGDPCTSDKCELGTCVYEPIVCDDGSVCTTDTCVGGNCQFNLITCDDGDACTNNLCDASTGCFYTPLDCDDNDFCTDDACLAGICTSTTHDCSDLNVCTLDSCAPATGCFYTAVVCDDFDACTDNSCDSSTGCFYTPIICNDGDACTEDQCDIVTGCFVIPVSCDDFNACTLDSCDSGSGCFYTNVVCVDSSLCTVDACDPATGCTFIPVDCDDFDECTVDNCDGLTGCFYVPLNCDDANACTADACDEFIGCFYNPTSCDDFNACTTEFCDPATGCVYDSVNCDDLNICTIDNCDPLLGCQYAPLDCNDGDACTIDQCDPGAIPAVGCFYTTVDCNDLNACTNDFCSAAVGCNYTNVICNDSSLCTTDVCDSATGCIFTAVVCDDLSACTTNDCDSTSGCFYTLIDCDDADACTTDGCDSTLGCTYTTVDCDDNSLCTTEICDIASGCVYTAVACDDFSLCTTDACDPATGCTYTLINCDDNSLCTIDGCDALTGCIYTAVDCNDNNVCTDDGCAADSGCFHQPVVCDDGDLCTDDICIDPIGCTYSPKVCVDGDLCTTDKCEFGVCVYLPLTCNDGTECTEDLCIGGICDFPTITCDDLDTCTIDACDPAIGCVYTRIPGCGDPCLFVNCDDGDDCTIEVCDSGTCVYTCTGNAAHELLWQKVLGGNSGDGAHAIQSTNDGGYIVAGYAWSNNGDVTGNNGQNDFWVTKLDANGGLLWQKALGGDKSETAYDIKQTADGGYIIAGSTATSNGTGDVSNNNGPTDFWVVKVDSTGNIVWDQSFGGNKSEVANSVYQTADGGYVVAGWASSNNPDGDVSGNHGGSDFWVIKLNTTGVLVWQKALGGSKGDVAKSIQQTADGGYIVAGYTGSNNGQVSGNHGQDDFWVVKLTSIGNITWQKALGGNQNEQANSVHQTADGGYIVAGTSNSNSGDVTGNHGQEDYWVVKLDAAGALQWQKSLGGTGEDKGNSVDETSDGGYFVAGSSASNNGNASGNNGGKDFWAVKLDVAGALQWQKSLGGNQNDFAFAAQQTPDGGYVLAGLTNSNNNGDVSGHRGGSDYWIVRLDADRTCVPTTDVAVALCSGESILIGGQTVSTPGTYFDTLTQVNGCDSILKYTVTIPVCNDNDPCTDNNCTAGVCSYTPTVCDDGDLCTIDVCGTNGCTNTALNCNDNNNCTTDECVAGACLNTPIIGCNCTGLVATITEQPLPVWCQGQTVTLVAGLNGGSASSFAWSNGATTSSVTVPVPGTYTVTVTNGNNCAATATFTTVLDQLLSSYVVLANRKVEMTRNTVFSGGVGVAGNNNKAEVKTNSVITAANTFVKADQITVNGGSTVTTQIPDPANLTLPPYEYNPNCGEDNDDDDDGDNDLRGITIPNNGTATLDNGNYGGITIGSNATVTFTNSDINIENIYAREGVTINFTSNCVKIRICKKLQLDDDNTFNAAGKNVVIFVGEDVTVDEGSAVTADIYMLGGKMTIKNSPANDPTVMRGLFMVHWLSAGDNTQWHQVTDCPEECYPQNQPTPCAGNAREVTGFTLVSATSDNDLGALADGAVIDLSLTGPISVRANVCLEQNVESVKFQLNGSDFRTESLAPYTIAGDNNGNYAAWNVTAGVYTIKAIPYGGNNATGVIGTPNEITITIIGCLPNERKVTSFTLMDADDEVAIGPLTDGMVIDLGVTGPINIRANVCDEDNIESVRFHKNGSQYRVESDAPYTFNGDNNGNYNNWLPAPGVYTVKATPYAGNNGNGAAGIPLQVTFTVVGSAAKMEGEETLMPEVRGDEATQLSAYPNPFTDRLNIEFTLTEDSRVTLEIFNLEGKRITQLFEGNVKANELQKYEYTADNLADGMIIYRLQTEKGAYFGKAVLAK